MSGEYDAFKNMLTSFPKGLVACVSDSYDIMKVAQSSATSLDKTILIDKHAKICYCEFYS